MPLIAAFESHADEPHAARIVHCLSNQNIQRTNPTLPEGCAGGMPSTAARAPRNPLAAQDHEKRPRFRGHAHTQTVAKTAAARAGEGRAGP